MLIEKGARIQVYDPQGKKFGSQLLDGVVWCEDALAAAAAADVTVVLTEWNEFRALDLSALKATMRGTVLVDLRNIFQPQDAIAVGLSYVSIGRPISV